MFHVIPRAEQDQRPNRTILFEGGQYGAPISLFLVDNAPGEGPAFTRIPIRKRGSSAPDRRSSPSTGKRSMPIPAISSSSIPKRRTVSSIRAPAGWS